ncbi:LapA family protein [Planktothrix sp. FACHB-1355]|uniref:LapA family protein n=1 Tax=Aerosakkonema funiforme FACHB-1375 TaxID=2949571 RepID=A0A926ZEA3_9CYAN|nr:MULTISPECIES: LapA family protein [Oscillatoriales]MBD2179843.1 LapA family protein [Aerosakkonema funiforme FACHB-1375]MBD3559845.1 LapA family protein [Planktothrix sp. FACHB-1355]
MSRIILLLVVLLGLIIFALQNLSPVVLVFLGMKSLGLPLGVWILGAIAAGFCSSLLIGALFQVSNYLSEEQLRSRIRTLEAEVSRSQGQAPRQSPYSNQTASYSTSTQTAPNWQKSSSNDDYLEDDEDEEDEAIYETPSYKDNVGNRANYEVKQEPTSSSKSGSVYSYSYKEPRNTGVGKTESVYDAEYRVITPPYRQPEPQQEESWQSDKKTGRDDDWGFEDDDDFDDEDDRPGSRS